MDFGLKILLGGLNQKSVMISICEIHIYVQILCKKFNQNRSCNTFQFCNDKWKISKLTMGHQPVYWVISLKTIKLSRGISKMKLRQPRNFMFEKYMNMMQFTILCDRQVCILFIHKFRTSVATASMELSVWAWCNVAASQSAAAGCILHHIVRLCSVHDEHCSSSALLNLMLGCASYWGKIAAAHKCYQFLKL